MVDKQKFFRELLILSQAVANLLNLMMSRLDHQQITVVWHCVSQILSFCIAGIEDFSSHHLNLEGEGTPGRPLLMFQMMVVESQDPNLVLVCSSLVQKVRLVLSIPHVHSYTQNHPPYGPEGP